MRSWKVTKFVKHEKDLNEIISICKEHYELLKNSHHAEAAISCWPYISINEYTQFAKRCNFIDAKFKMSAIDRLFIATNYELEA